MSKSFEQFNPVEFQRHDDLPEEEKNKFKPVENGFVWVDALSEPEALDRAKKIREKIDADNARSYEEAALIVDAKIAKDKWEEEFKDIQDKQFCFDNRFEPKTDREKEAKEVYIKEVDLLKRAAEHVGYLNLLEGEPKDKKVFLRAIVDVLKYGTYKVFTRDLQNKIKNQGEFIIENSNYFTQINMLDAYGYFGVEKSVFERLEKKFITAGEFDLYFKLINATGGEIDKDNFRRLGEQALKNESPFDAVHAFEISGEEDLQDKARLLEERKIAKAKEKIQEMPDGFMTKNLMSHESSVGDFKNILLKDGILSGAEYRKKYGEKKMSYGNDLQLSWGCYDYISVWNPWSGYGTKPDHAEISRKLRRKINKFLEPYITKIDLKSASIEEKVKLQKEALVYYNPWDTSRKILMINEELACDPKYSSFFKELNDIFEEEAEIKEIPAGEPTLYNYNYWDDHYATPIEGDMSVKGSKKINPLRFFNPQKVVDLLSTKPIFLINPNKKRFVTFSSGYGPESFIKTKISPDEIVGIVAHKETRRENLAFNYLLKIAEQSGTPLYIGNSDTPADYNHGFDIDMEGNYDFELVWPERQENE